MGTLHDAQLTLQALGRPAFLGQLYDAANDTLMIAPQCWNDPADIEKHTVAKKNGSLSVDYKDITGLSDRTDLLKVSGELEVSILSGALTLSGSGSFLDSSQEKISTREVSASALQETEVKRLTYDIGDLEKDEFERFKNLGASHVVTEIRYGGRIVATFKEKSLTSESEKKVGGKFSASLMKGMGKAFEVEGSVEVDDETVQKANSLDIAFNLHADAQMKITPTSVADVFTVIQNWGRTMKGASVPLTLTLTPLSRFVDESTESKTLNAMRGADIKTIAAAYNELISLNGRRSALTSELLPFASLFPSLYKKSKDAASALNKVTVAHREALSSYLMRFRTDGRKAGKVADLIKPVNKVVSEHQDAYAADEQHFKLLMSLVSSAGSSAPLVDANELRTKMANADGVLGLVCVPQSPKANELKNLFRVLLNRIQLWREKEDDRLGKSIAGTTDPRARKGMPAESFKTTYATFYIEEGTAPDILSIDGQGMAIKKALEECAKDNEPRFVYFDFVTASGIVLDRMDWFLFNRGGWGFINNEEEGWSYIGEVKDGKPHGNGTITYSDKSTYTGSWWSGTRHGLGEGESGKGVYVDNRWAEDGVMIEMRVYANHRIVGYKSIPLRRYNSLQAHVRTIATMMGWTTKDRFTITIYSKDIKPKFEPKTVEVEGGIIAPERVREDSDLPTSTWPLEFAATLKAERTK